MGKLKKKFEDNTVLFPTLTISELEGLLYNRAKLANDSTFKGIYPYIRQAQDERRDILERLDHIESILKLLIKDAAK